MTAVKICGLSTPETVAAAVEGGAEYLGFVFYGPSPRNVTPQTAGRLAAATPPGVQRVGLFVDAGDDEIAAVLAAVAIDMLQFHGRETPERIADAKLRHRHPVIKACPIAGREDVLAARRYESTADMLLFDAKAPPSSVLPGGNGAAFDWRLLAGETWSRPWMLSGGLTPETVAEAIRLSHAPAVDVSSGVESAPGVKSPERIAAFLAAARRV